MKKILVALSGGVDSTVCAYILKQQGFEIEGVYMRLFEDASFEQKNLHNIKIISDFLNIKYQIVDFQEDFKKEVYDDFVNTYKKGETPNPCVRCNKKIKLGKLVQFALDNGFDALATGHYAKIKNNFIVSAKDDLKDQSYFLSAIDKKYIKYLMFPLGDMLKEDVKKIAKEIPILKTIASQKESTEICFVQNSYLDILKRHFNVDIKGEVLDIDGNVIGEHFGYTKYTIGQRRGFRLKKAHKPHYVFKIIPQKNQIVVATKEKLLKNEFFIKELSFFDIPKNDIIECEVKIRYKAPKIKCKIFLKENKVVLKEPQVGITPSQVAAFYDKDRLIGSALIKK